MVKKNKKRKEKRAHIFYLILYNDKLQNLSVWIFDDCRRRALIGAENYRRGPLFDHPSWRCSRMRGLLKGPSRMMDAACARV